MIYKGTVIAGTHIPAEYIPALMGCLADLDPVQAHRMSDQYGPVLDALGSRHDADHSLPEQAAFLSDALFDALNDVAPEGYYFGAHPDDGADFGFWPRP